MHIISSSGLLARQCRLLLSAFRSGPSCGVISWARASSVVGGKEAETVEADTKEPTTAPCVSPGELRAAKLCGLTGLCSRTKVNIINTNMRCPTCLLDVLDKQKTVTFFPAVPIESTVRLAHHRTYPAYTVPLEGPKAHSSASIVSLITVMLPNKGSPYSMTGGRA
jgi:hypothetical protein